VHLFYVEAESPPMSEIRFPGRDPVTSAAAEQVPDREVTALYAAHALSLTRLAVFLGSGIMGDAPDLFIRYSVRTGKVDGVSGISRSGLTRTGAS
jgi:hypothetical protein